MSDQTPPEQLAERIERDALRQIAHDLADISEHSEAQLMLAADAPQGSLARMWLLQLLDRYRGQASGSVGRVLLWSQAVSWHRAQRAAGDLS